MTLLRARSTTDIALVSRCRVCRRRCLSVGFVVVVARLVESSIARAIAAMKHVADPRLMKSLSTGSNRAREIVKTT